jgi:RNA polymerase sigma-70 factor (ECF subfamily)
MAVGYAASLLGDAQGAEDVAQEAFVEAFSRLASLRVPEAFPGLLKALVRKHCDRLTRRRCLAVISLEDASATEDASAAMVGRTDPVQMDPTMHHVQEAARREMVQKAVHNLPASEREVVLLFYMGDQSHQHIAETLGIPVSTVKSRLHEARVRLKRLLWPLGEDGLPGERSAQPNRVHEVVIKKKYVPEPGGMWVVKKKYVKESG